MIDWNAHPHRRLNPLTGEWVIVSPQRNNRPWQGQIETPAVIPSAAYDPSCYLCPRNERAGGARNPDYDSVMVFDNDFPGLIAQTPVDVFDDHGLLRAETEAGICRVVCFSPHHNLAVSAMETAAIARVVDIWCEQYLDLGNLPFINYVQIFENRGEMMGASNPHPHCQIWASASIPNEPAKENAAQKLYHEEHGSCLLCDYLAIERSSERLVCENESFAIVVPFWAVWPFETLLIANRHVTGLDELTYTERAALADILKQIAVRYDNLFETAFPCSMGLHQRPTDGSAHNSSHLHGHYYPPLLRSASIRKFMVGYELLASPQRDLTPESAAARLRSAG